MMQSRSVLTLLMTFAMVLTPFVQFIDSPIASAAYASDWRAGNIIDDQPFTNPSAMSVSQIQTWLDVKLKYCDPQGTLASELSGGIDYNSDGVVTRAEYGRTMGNPAPFTCLNNYYEVPKTQPGPNLPASNYGKTTIPTGAKSAAQLIYDAAQAYNISPKVLLVKLGTESPGPLTSDTWPFKVQYKYAMGARCPDSGPGGSANCDTDYAGFSLQMREAAKLLRWYLDNMQESWWSYKKPYATNHILWNVVETGCGGKDVYIQNKATAALYTYTPYQPNTAALNNLYGTGDGCSAYGNRNFWRVYTDWFGSTKSPKAIKSASSSAVYLQSEGYKFSVPSMALLQDYGIQPSAIRTVSDSTLGSIPTGASPLSPSIGYVVKSPSDTDVDGGAVYLISIGKRYKVTNMDQYNAYSLGSIGTKYLPLSLILSMPDGGYLSDFIATTSNNVFSVSGGVKRIIFEGSLYSSLNASGKVTRVSMGTSYIIASGKPISSKPIALQKKSGAVYLYANNDDSYRSVSSMNEYRCWGISGVSGVPLYRVASDTYFDGYQSSPPLSCSVTDSTSGDRYVLRGTTKSKIPASVTIPTQSIAGDLSSVASRLPTRSNNLSSLVKSPDSVTAYYLEGDKKRPIPSYANLKLLGYPQTPLDIIDTKTIESISPGDIKIGIGALIKSDTDKAVYVVTGNSRTAINSVELFNAYKNPWSSIETYSQSVIDANHPLSETPVERLLSTNDENVNYLVDGTGCKTVDSVALSKLGKTPAEISPYSPEVYRYLKPAVNCTTKLNSYIKDKSHPTVYAIESGQKRPVSSWSTLLEHSSSSSPDISIVSTSTLESIPNGPSL